MAAIIGNTVPNEVLKAVMKFLLDVFVDTDDVARFAADRGNTDVMFVREHAAIAKQLFAVRPNVMPEARGHVKWVLQQLWTRQVRVIMYAHRMAIKEERVIFRRSIRHQQYIDSGRMEAIQEAIHDGIDGFDDVFDTTRARLKLMRRGIPIEDLVWMMSLIRRRVHDDVWVQMTGESPPESDAEEDVEPLPAETDSEEEAEVEAETEESEEAEADTETEAEEIE